MLIATITAITIMMSGGGADTHWSVLQTLNAMSNQIEEHVEDPARVGQAQDLIVDQVQDVETFIGVVLAQRQQIYELDLHYTTTAVEYQAAFVPIEAAWVQMEQDLVELQCDLREVLTREEWDAVYQDLNKKRE